MPRCFQWFTSDMKTFENIWTEEDWVISVAGPLLANTCQWNQPAGKTPESRMRGGRRSGAAGMWSKRWEEMMKSTEDILYLILFFFLSQQYLGHHVTQRSCKERAKVKEWKHEVRALMQTKCKNCFCFSPSLWYQAGFIWHMDVGTCIKSNSDLKTSNHFFHQVS